MLNWTNMSLRKKILLLFILIQIIILAGIMIYLNYYQRELYLNQLRKNTLNEMKLLLENEKLNVKQQTEDLQGWVRNLAEEIDKRITIIDKYGNVLADSDYNPSQMDNHINRPEVQEVIDGNNYGFAIRRSNTLKKDMFYMALSIKNGESIEGFIRISESLDDINGSISQSVFNYLLFFLFIFVLGLIFLWKFASNIINPLSKLANLASGLAHGDFTQRIKLKSYQNEIGVLASNFNYMASQLEHKIKEISEEKNRAEAILTSMVDGLIATDSGKHIRIINPAARQMFAIQEKEVEGKDIIEIVRHHEVDRLLGKCLDENKIICEEITLQRGEKKTFRCTFAPINDEEQKVTGGIIVFSDITELRRLEQVRTEFVANVSHELRTPLTSIIGYVDTILENEIKDFSLIGKFLKIIKTEADRLELLIKDLLDLSKLESKVGELKFKEVNMLDIFKKTVMVLKEKADEKDIKINIDVEEGLPPAVVIPEQIEQVMINLIDNSIKYTPDGGKIIARAYKKIGKVVVEVEDNGIGIPKEEQVRIFERFYRVDKARSRAVGGTGIGLSIVKHIIQNHQSQIEVESELGQGSIFRFYLDIAK